jgi:hypothetical protein
MTDIQTDEFDEFERQWLAAHGVEDFNHLSPEQFVEYLRASQRWVQAEVDETHRVTRAWVEKNT